MLNKILPIVITLAAVGGAGFAAMTIKGGPAPIPTEAHGDGDGHGSAGGVHEVQEEEDLSGFGYFNFRRNFIVPVMGTERVQALVLINVSIEMEETKIDQAQIREPSIRDAFMKTLLSMSHEGVFNQDITNPEVYSEVQERLLETARVSIDESVRSILLVDYARQDQ